MIVFDLKCVCDFTFEGWFRDRSDFENQLSGSYLVCPRCGSREVHKILSPIRFQSAADAEQVRHKQSTESTVSPDEAGKALAILQKYVEENFEDVGADLARESLKIHFGVAHPRNIRGVTTETEEEELRQEGIKLLKIPMPLKSEKSN